MSFYVKYCKYRMERLHTILFLFFVFAFSVFSLNLSPDTKQCKVNTISRFEKDLKLFLNQVNQFEHWVNLWKKKKIHPSKKEIDAEWFKLRAAYKHAEFLIEQIDPGAAVLLNGPNIQRMDAYDNSSNELIWPSGMQVIEELLYTYDDTPNFTEITQQLLSLKKNLQNFESTASHVVIDEKMIWDALESECIRIQTMGITGFDSPFSELAIFEARESILSISIYIKFWLPTLTLVSNADAYNLRHALDQSNQYLARHPNFNQFNRVEFIRIHGKNIYSSIKNARKDLLIATAENFHSAWRPRVHASADYLFDRDFLNPYAFSSVPSDTFNTNLWKLGRTLFFDPVLSVHGERSCAACHIPELAFTDGKKKSMAFEMHGNVKRNAPTLINSAFQNSFFHDMRALTMELQIQGVMNSEKEFNSSLYNIIGTLNISPDYKKMFDDVFPADTNSRITLPMVLKALSFYVRSLSGLNSVFDQYMRNEIPVIPKQVIHGANLFMGKAKCATCHFAPIFNGTVPPSYMDTESEVLGVTENTDFAHPKLDEDLGRFRVTKQSIHRNAFKTPTVRNVALTAPYMHHGSFATLEDVVEFYRLGGGRGLGLDVPNQTLPFDSLVLTKDEIADIVSFMKALTDTSGLTSRPDDLPKFPGVHVLNQRIIGGMY